MEYVSTGNAWTTSALFKYWFHNSFCKQVKSFLKNQHVPEKALLLIDNAPCHCSEEKLISKDGKIFTLFLSPNCTALIQPMDQNPIKLRKLNYKKGILAHISLLEDGDDVGKCIKRINLLDAVCLLHNTWKKVTTNSLEKCWHKLLSGNLPNYDPDDLIPLSLLQRKWQQIGQGYQEISNMLTQINGEIHTNDEMYEWVENIENVIEDVNPEVEAIDDGTDDEEVDIQQKKSSTWMQ